MTAQMATRLTLRTFKHKKRKVTTVSPITCTENVHEAKFSALSIAVQRTTVVPKLNRFQAVVERLQVILGRRPELSSAVGDGHSSKAESRPLSVGTVKSPGQSILGRSVSAIGLYEYFD